MLDRLDRAGRDEQAARVAAALEAGDAGREELERELAALRGNRGRAAVVLDELSRSDSARVRAWVPAIGAEILDEDSSRLLLSLTRDRDVAVREAALTALIGLGPEAVAPALPDLRRRLHSKDEAERAVALKALAAAGDPDAAAALREAGA
jgi:HEAT repeat protein